MPTSAKAKVLAVWPDMEPAQAINGRWGVLTHSTVVGEPDLIADGCTSRIKAIEEAAQHHSVVSYWEGKEDGSRS